MILANSLKSGMTFLKNGKLLKVVDAAHHKPGKGNTIMRMKIKDVRSGSIYETSFRPNEKLEKANIETKIMKYSYSVNEMVFFLDLKTYNEYEIPFKHVQNEMKYILENTEVKIRFFENEIIDIQLPKTVTLPVSETRPSIKGASVTVSGKPAKMKTGLVITVPDFIKKGDWIEINTIENIYVKRTKETSR